MTLSSCFIIIIITQRRLAFFILLFSLLISIIIYLKNNSNKLLIRMFFVITIFFSIYILLNKFFFTGKRAISYIEMIQPRLNGIVDVMTEHFYSRGNDFYFGKLKGWGNIESGFLNLLLNTGIVGLLCYLSTFIILIYFIFQRLNFLIIKKNICYIFFSFCVLCLSNVVNNSISTPYFFISFFIIFVIALIKKDHYE